MKQTSCLSINHYYAAIINFNLCLRVMFGNDVHRYYRFRLRHVRDDPVGDDQQDEVLRAVPKVLRDVGHVIDGRSKVSRPVELNIGQATSIRL